MLSAQQLLFLANRLVSKTDKDAAIATGVHPTRVADWKTEDPEFAAEYEAAFSDGIKLAQNITRQHLGIAATRLAEGLDATKTIGVRVEGEHTDKGAPVYQDVTVPDHTARLKAVELMFKAHGLLLDRTEHSIDLSNMTDEELLLLERLIGRTPLPGK